MEGETPSVGRRNVKLSWQSGAHTEWKKICRFYNLSEIYNWKAEEF